MARGACGFAQIHIFLRFRFPNPRTRVAPAYARPDAEPEAPLPRGLYARLPRVSSASRGIFGKRRVEGAPDQ
ncbi:hypothetical protein NSU_2128 [Novosphingobium pentaromativorans US6-1]|uniref:Uncharacterized protein n=1 Tax=Novosphingobium pentaromativorans US6-1 TaxID=1088721 RepID=G6ECQ4_9SPHN|nr:hypothetical protein NSU_2128 [Novosphingobium pentaromativorans US6-1]